MAENIFDFSDSDKSVDYFFVGLSTEYFHYKNRLYLDQGL